MSSLENWPQELTKWLEKQHGTAGWETKLESFIAMLLHLQKTMDAEIVENTATYLDEDGKKYRYCSCCDDAALHYAKENILSGKI